MRSFRRSGFVAVLWALVTSCSWWDSRSEEQTGKDLAGRGLNFSKGAAEALEEKGKDLGKSLGKGVAEAVKGAGSAVKDTLYPSVNLVTGSLKGSIKVLAANEGNSDRASRRLVANLNFLKNFHGRMQIFALGTSGTELAKSKPTNTLKKKAGSTERVEFEFPKDTRFSRISKFQMKRLAPREMKVNSMTASLGIKASQFSDTVDGASAYITFTQGFRGSFHLRAYDAFGEEIGRSRNEFVYKTADSADYFQFTFPKQTNLDEVIRYELHAK